MKKKNWPHITVEPGCSSAHHFAVFFGKVGVLIDSFLRGTCKFKLQIEPFWNIANVIIKLEKRTFLHIDYSLENLCILKIHFEMWGKGYPSVFVMVNSLCNIIIIINMFFNLTVVIQEWPVDRA